MEQIDFKKLQGLVPAIIQDEQTNEVYMLGFMNEEALNKTKETGIVYFWSRTRGMLWMKGETSGNKLQVKKIMVDCDSDTLLIFVSLIGSNVCHTGNKTCFNTLLPITK
jgi:phosphoribosyl-ATP pyrophosphohydrolase/phosphoribosyl-AMP cyclohydrolase